MEATYSEGWTFHKEAKEKTGRELDSGSVRDQDEDMGMDLFVSSPFRIV